jgi:hypothetical protein
MKQLCAFLGALALAGASHVYGAGVLPVPAVTRSLAASAPGDPSHDYPFYAAIGDLKAQGYVEEEFLIQGAANRYNTPAQATGSIIDGGHPFRTRMLVRRPAAPGRFNGTVIVEWNNVTGGRDLDIDWFQTNEHLIRSGYAWVGVTPQRVGVEALKLWNAKRYGTLDVTVGGKIDADALSYDVFAQAAQAIRTPGATNVMGGLPVQRIFATGHSQSAGRLATYVNSIHPLAPVFDAVIVHGGGGRIRTDLDIPVWKLLAETDVIGSQAANRQPDTAKFRSWEVAGTSHVDLKFVTYSRQLSARDGAPTAPPAGRVGVVPLPNPGGARGDAAGPQGGAGAPAVPQSGADRGAPPPPTGNSGGCDRPPYSHIPFHHVMNAAIDHLVRWVRDGVAPPVAPPIETVAAGPPAVISRDARGNALGGIRLAQHAVPTGVNTGQNSGPGFCRLNGSHEAFDAATLAALYPTHADYVRSVREATQKSLNAGYILKVDADATIAEAERSDIGRR